jgi:hypothetical protein
MIEIITSSSVDKYNSKSSPANQFAEITTTFSSSSALFSSA